jgi:polysaccharide biosynthesis protein PslG
LALLTRISLVAILVLSAMVPLNAAPLETELDAPLDQQSDPRMFPETGFAVTDQDVWDFYNARGGPATFGYPISRMFQFRDLDTQFFERQVVVKVAGQGVGLINVMDLLPYSPIDGYQIPTSDPGWVAGAPSLTAPDFPALASAYVADWVPDVWREQPVNFRTLLVSSIPGSLYQGNLQAQVVAAVQIWGFPVSQVTQDPQRPSIWAQRFQRGVAVYNAENRTSRFLPFGSYLYRVIAGSLQPEDLANQARNSGLWAQYNPLEPRWVNRPNLLPQTNLTMAFRPTSELSLPPAPATVPRAQSPEYGMNIFIWGQPETTARDLSRVGELGFTWQKSLFQWKLIEPQKGVFNWTEPDRVVRESNALGINIIARVDFQPSWARGDAAHNGPPERYSDYGDFIFALVDRYKEGSPYGTVAAVELWNEPNISREWGNQVISRGSAADYVRLMCIGHEAAKRASPQVVTISAGLSPTGTLNEFAADDTVFLQWMYDAGARSCFEVLGAHGAGYKAPPSIGPDELARDRTWGGHPSFGFRRVEQLRDIMVRNGDGQKQVWLLEFGWTSDPVNQAYAWHRVSEEQKAQYIVDAYRWARDRWQPWIGVMTLWNMPAPDWTSTREEYWWSIANPDGSTRPAFDSLLRARRDGYLP